MKWAAAQPLISLPRTMLGCPSFAQKKTQGTGTLSIENAKKQKSVVKGRAPPEARFVLLSYFHVLLPT